jgi:hypothetical protein
MGEESIDQSLLSLSLVRPQLQAQFEYTRNQLILAGGYPSSKLRKSADGSIGRATPPSTGTNYPYQCSSGRLSAAGPPRRATDPKACSRLPSAAA